MTEEEKAAAVAQDKSRKDAEEKEKADRAKADAESGEKLDKLLTHMDSFGRRMDTDAEDRKALSERMDAVCSRLDAIEGKKGDGEETAEEKAAKEDKAKKDGEIPEAFKKEEKEKADKAKKDAEEEAEKAKKADSDLAAIKMAVADLAKRTPRAMTDADYTAMAGIQARADSVLMMHGLRASRPQDGETIDGYRLRMASALKAHSATWKGVDLTKIVADAEAFKIAEGGIYADAEAAAMRPINGPTGELRAVARTDSDTGRRTIDFFGQGSFVRQFKQPRRLIAATNLNRRERG